jgi:anaerobic ribonucleoside-triphosphate reductase activating protein
MKYNVLDIVRGTTVDGPGFRTSIYLAGCGHQCPGCHNPQSWDPAAGSEYYLEDILKVVKEEDFNVTLTGGDPLFNPESTKALVDGITALGYTVWLYTGFTWEQIMASSTLSSAVENVEAVVEGPFIESQRDVTLRFRGSSNQRIIRVKDGADIS